jgi:Fur family transcriptional regulator, ferric uptake regulator
MAGPRELQVFEDFIHERGLRMTSERRAVCEEIFAQHVHLDAGALLNALRKRRVPVSRATVYRNLDLLVECGLVRRQRLGSGRTLYEHVHAGQEHDHLVCESCGRVVEFVSPGIVALRAEICRAHGFEPQPHGLQILGRCRECAAREAQRA